MRWRCSSRGEPNAGELDEAGLVEKLTPVFGERTSEVIEAHRRNRPEETPWDLRVSISSEDRRLLSIETAEAKGGAGWRAGLHVPVHVGEQPRAAEGGAHDGDPVRVRHAGFDADCGGRGRTGSRWRTRSARRGSRSRGTGTRTTMAYLDGSRTTRNGGRRCCWMCRRTARGRSSVGGAAGVGRRCGRVCRGRAWRSSGRSAEADRQRATLE